MSEKLVNKQIDKIDIIFYITLVVWAMSVIGSILYSIYFIKNMDNNVIMDVAMAAGTQIIKGYGELSVVFIE